MTWWNSQSEKLRLNSRAANARSSSLSSTKRIFKTPAIPIHISFQVLVGAFRLSLSHCYQIQARPFPSQVSDDLNFNGANTYFVSGEEESARWDTADDCPGPVSLDRSFAA